MSSRLRFSPQARADLLDIAKHIALDNPAAALETLAALQKRCALLTRFPRLGPRRADIAPDARALVEGSYLILYREISAGVEVVRVVHGARRLRDMVT